MTTQSPSPLPDAVTPLLLATIMTSRGNPWGDLWVAAARRAGYQVAPLSLAAVRGAGARPVVVHVQWPELAVCAAGRRATARRLLRLTRTLLAARRRHHRVLVTVHNAAAHEDGGWAERAVWALLGRTATDVHLLSAAGADEVFAVHPALRSTRRHVVPHGDYRGTLGEVPPRARARADLGLTAGQSVLASFGALREYKGVDTLVEAFAALPDPAARLVVAGAPVSAPMVAVLRASAESDGRILLRDRALPDDELHAVVSAADLVVLPYRKILNSGSAVLALSLDRPVLVPATPTMLELQERVGTRWVRVFHGRLATADLAAAMTDLPGEDEAPDLSWCSWDEVTRLLARLSG